MTRPDRLGSRAFGGGPLQGDRLVRVVYLDEAGISNPKHEPFVVVAGIVVNGDAQWKPLEAELRKIVDEEIPEEMREGFVFHATELFSGGSKFSRDDWPKERRWSILDRILSIPKRYNVPVAWGFVDRTQMFVPEDETMDRTVIAHGVAFIICGMSIERWMRENTQNEVATLIAEDNHLVRKFLKGAQVMAQRGRIALPSAFTSAGYLPFERIVDTVHFAGKTESSLLQIADACTFAIKRKLMKKPDADRFFDPLKSQTFFALNRDDFVPPLSSQ